MKAPHDPVAVADANEASIQPESPRSSTRLSDSLTALAVGAMKQPFKSIEGLGRATAALVDVTLGRSTIAPSPWPGSLAAATTPGADAAAADEVSDR